MFNKKKKKIPTRIVEFINPTHDGIVLYESINYIDKIISKKIDLAYKSSDPNEVRYLSGVVFGLREAYRILTYNYYNIIDEFYIEAGKCGKI